MVDGKKFDNIIKEGYVLASSGSFTDVVTITLPATTGKFFYAKGWVLGCDTQGGMYIKKFSQVGLGSNLLKTPGTEISESKNTTTVTPNAQIVVHGTIVKLQANANFAEIGFYGRLEVQAILKEING